MQPSRWPWNHPHHQNPLDKRCFSSTSWTVVAVCNFCRLLFHQSLHTVCGWWISSARSPPAPTIEPRTRGTICETLQSITGIEKWFHAYPAGSRCSSSVTLAATSYMSRRNLKKEQENLNRPLLLFRVLEADKVRSSPPPLLCINVCCSYCSSAEVIQMCWWGRWVLHSSGTSHLFLIPPETVFSFTSWGERARWRCACGDRSVCSEWPIIQHKCTKKL